MKKKFTFYARTVACTVLTLSLLIINSFTAKTYAQIGCSNESVLFLETFGTGTTATSSPDVSPTVLTYQETGLLTNSGTYRVVNNTKQTRNWHNSDDHTPNDVDGKTLVINGTSGAFYTHQITRATGFVSGTYTATLFIMNLDKFNSCGGSGLLPQLTFRVEYLSGGGTWEPFVGSPYTAPPVSISTHSTWVEIGSPFTLPLTASLITSVRIVLTDLTGAGCGNDFAIDDIKFSLCPAGGPLPVEFLKINARQKGSGVSIEWSTSQEINSKSYVIERSLTGNSSWNAVAYVNGAGNSSTVKNYNAYDAQPSRGVNFYRIKQVDIDGNYKYSKTVNVKLTFTKTGISVLANPFHNSLTIDFSSASDQVVNARLIDISGKQVGIEKWSINTGSTRKDFSNVSGLQRGMYILTVTNSAGEILYNNKVIKE
ncbi:MAG: T9SS type A sorting domain-containing protein [Ginsengibacter sp.]